MSNSSGQGHTSRKNVSATTLWAINFEHLDVQTLSNVTV